MRFHSLWVTPFFVGNKQITLKAKRTPAKMDLDVNLLAGVICWCAQNICVLTKAFRIAKHAPIDIISSSYSSYFLGLRK
jgi:hypothetical protein